jgi:hypothetical protein
LSKKVSQKPLQYHQYHTFYGIFHGIKLKEKIDTMPLTDLFVKTLKPSDTPKKFQDHQGLYLYVTPSGLKSWRYNYTFDKKQQTLTFGTYPMTSLREAREKLLEAKKTIKSGVNPAVQKRAVKETEKTDSTSSFEFVAREWFENK